MERVRKLLGLLPELVQRGMLDSSGGSFAVRTRPGLYTSPLQAGPELRWHLTLEDLVLFPGPGEASMARAGRQPCRDNRIHRAILSARPDWNFSFHCHTWGLLAFCLAEQALPVVAEHYHMIKPGRDGSIRCLPRQPGGTPPSEADVVAELGKQFQNLAHGALLLGGNGPLICGAGLESVLSLAEMLELLARAQQWRLAAQPAPKPAATGSGSA